MKIIYVTNPIWETNQIPDGGLLIAQKIKIFTKQDLGVLLQTPLAFLKKASAKTLMATPFHGVLKRDILNDQNKLCIFPSKNDFYNIKA